LYAFIISPIRSTRPIQLTVIHLITLIKEKEMKRDAVTKFSSYWCGAIKSENCETRPRPSRHAIRFHWTRRDVRRHDTVNHLSGYTCICILEWSWSPQIETLT
jgi:hypothetical protein